MLRYLVSRVAIMVPMMAIVLFLVFMLGFFGPGDPIKLLFYTQYETWNPEQIEIERRKFGLDQPVLVQYMNYMVKFAQGDFGTNFQHQPIAPRLKVSLPISLQLGASAAVVVFILGLPLGVFAALRANSFADYFIVGGALTLRTIPVFVLAPLLMIVFVLELKLLKVGWGWQGPFHVQSILPIGLMAIGPLAIVIRQTRAGVLEVLASDYVRTARAKGLPNHLIIVRHILRNAMIPVVTSFGLIVEGLILGSVFLERLFAIPGFGNITTTAIQTRDFPTFMATAIFSALAVMISNLIVDLTYPLLDARVTLD